MGIALFFMGQSLFAQIDSNDKQGKSNAITKIVESGLFSIDVNRALPLSGHSISLTTVYSLSLNKDTVISNLPYFGRAYTVPYGGGYGLNFKEIALDKSRERTKKGASEIKFKVKTQEDIYSFRLSIYANGNTTINVLPSNKQPITFYGNIRLDME